MKSIVAFASLFACAVAYSPLVVSSLTTQQPTGNPDGQEDYWIIEFNVNSTNGDTAQSGFCHASWGDNEGLVSPQVPYSTYVPTGSWMKCDSSEANFGDEDSEFSFQLFPLFSIGDFSLAVEQEWTQTTNNISAQLVASGKIQVTNTTAQYTCTINPEEVPSAGVHASGDCSIPAGQPPYQIPLTSVSAACTPNASTVAVAFPVTETTQWGETVVVVGNITQLGNWAPSEAVILNADQYTSLYNLWNGTVVLPAGTAFQYKYILEHTDGSIAWECCENRVYTVPSNTCGTATAGNDPDEFRN